MQAASFFGYICPTCKSTIDIGVMMGNTKPNCSQCNTDMIPNANGKTVATNVYCKNCNCSYGMVNSDKCPQCNGEFSAIPTN